MRLLSWYVLLSSCVVATACRKTEVETLVVIKEVERQYSWTSTKSLLGNFNILLGVGKGPNGLYFQQPTGFAALEQKNSGALTYTQYLYSASTDLLVRVPIGSDFFVSYSGDSLVWLVPNVSPVTSPSGALIRLNKLDPHALRVQRNVYSFNKFAAISAHNVVLFPYESAQRDNQNHLVLARVSTAPYSSPSLPRYQVQTQLLSLPLTNGIYPYSPQLLTAIDDYFLVDCGSEGVFKISESGTVHQVLPAYTGVDAFYSWQGVVYATLDGSRFAVSRDKGETWQLGTGPDLRYTTFQTVGDSLVGVYHGIGGYLFTYRQDLARKQWHIRPLKDDGLNQTDINGLATWGDTVYLATSSGLFKRPLSKFFDSREK